LNKENSKNIAESHKNESRDVARSIKPSISHITGAKHESMRRNLDVRKLTSVQNPKEPILVVLEKPNPNGLLTLQGNFDLVLNSNLVSKNNMILDDSILEVRF